MHSTPLTRENKHELYTAHEKVLKNAIAAIHSREFYAQYPEIPSGKVYGETANEEQQTIYNNQLHSRFSRLQQNHDYWLLGAEESPYTLEHLGISYPAFHSVENYVSLSEAAGKQWKQCTPEERAGLLVECLERLKKNFFEIAYATMHTTGQSFMMSFQASGPHASDRALEAIALGYHEQSRFPGEVTWDKPMGKMNVVLRKFYRVIPRGISLNIGCSTFPIWNSAPGVFASLVTGNTVIIKPHPRAIYPLAILTAEIQNTLREFGYDPNVVLLAPDTPDSPITKQLAENPAVKLIDFTGGNAFGNYIESLPNKITFTEKAGVNSVIFDSCTDLKGAMQNLAFSVSLYSGQMCTCPQNFYFPKKGVSVNGEHVSYDNLVKEFTSAITALVTNEKAGPGTLGAIQNNDTYRRIQEAKNAGGKVLLDSKQILNPEFPKARIATPLVIEVPANRRDIFEKEMFGPVVYIIPTESTKQSVELAKDLSLRHGALTCAAYCTDPATSEMITREMGEAFTPVSFNLTGPIWVNQSAGFSDFHVSGGNPAGNASFTNPEFVLKRFVIVGMRAAG